MLERADKVDTSRIGKSVLIDYVPDLCRKLHEGEDFAFGKWSGACLGCSLLMDARQSSHFPSTQKYIEPLPVVHQSRIRILNSLDHRDGM